MIRLFYLDIKYLLLIFGAWFLAFYLIGFHWLLVFFSVMSLSFLFFYRRKPKLDINFDKDNGIIFSPVDGVIKHVEIQKQYQIIHIRRNFMKEWGVYLPTCGKIEEVNDFEGSNNWTGAQFTNYSEFSRKNIVINSKFGDYDMSILNNPFSGFDCLVESGDYGFSGARFGIIKGGADIMMFLPKEFSVVMEAKEQLKASESIIAVNTTVKDIQDLNK